MRGRSSAHLLEFDGICHSIGRALADDRRRRRRRRGPPIVIDPLGLSSNPPSGYETLGERKRAVKGRGEREREAS